MIWDLPSDITSKILRKAESTDRSAFALTCTKAAAFVREELDSFELAAKDTWLRHNDSEQLGPSRHPSPVPALSAIFQNSLSHCKDDTSWAHTYSDLKKTVAVLSTAFAGSTMLATPPSPSMCTRLVTLARWQRGAQWEDDILPLLVNAQYADMVPLWIVRDDAPAAPMLYMGNFFPQTVCWGFDVGGRSFLEICADQLVLGESSSGQNEYQLRNELHFIFTGNSEPDKASSLQKPAFYCTVRRAGQTSSTRHFWLRSRREVQIEIIRSLLAGGYADNAYPIFYAKPADEKANSRLRMSQT